MALLNLCTVYPIVVYQSDLTRTRTSYHPLSIYGWQTHCSHCYFDDESYHFLKFEDALSNGSFDDELDTCHWSELTQSVYSIHGLAPLCFIQPGIHDVAVAYSSKV